MNKYKILAWVTVSYFEGYEPDWGLTVEAESLDDALVIAADTVEERLKEAFPNIYPDYYVKPLDEYLKSLKGKKSLFYEEDERWFEE